MIEWLLALTVPLGFFALVWILSWLGGWRALAAHYAAEEKPSGDFRSFQRAKFGWVGYNGCMTIGVCREGLFLATWPILRIGHPPLLIPWSDLERLERRQTVLWAHVRVGVQRPAIATIDLPVAVYVTAVEGGYLHLDGESTP